MNQKSPDELETVCFLLFEIPGEKFPALRAGSVLVVIIFTRPFGRDFNRKSTFLEIFCCQNELFSAPQAKIFSISVCISDFLHSHDTFLNTKIRLIFSPGNFTRKFQKLPGGVFFLRVRALFLLVRIPGENQKPPGKYPEKNTA